MVAPLVIGAGITAAAGLLQNYLAQKAQQEQTEETRAMEAERQRVSGIQNAQNNMLQITGQSGDRESNALQNLIGVFQRSMR